MAIPIVSRLSITTVKDRTSYAAVIVAYAPIAQLQPTLRMVKQAHMPGKTANLAFLVRIAQWATFHGRLPDYSWCG